MLGWRWLRGCGHELHPMRIKPAHRAALQVAQYLHELHTRRKADEL